MQELYSQNENIKKITDFVNNPKTRVCFLEGRTGAFKTYCVDKALKELKENEESDTLIYNLKCFESTTLDDIFLLFLNTIKDYAQKKKIVFTKAETNDIAQRINRYIAGIKSPSVVVIDSMQNVFNNTNEKDKEEIIRFILHLATLKNYKIILVSNSFSEEFVEKFQTGYTPNTKIEMLPLTKQEVENYFQEQGHFCSNEDIKKFLELTKGSPASLFITSSILTVLKTSLTMLLEEYTTKQIPFGKYIVQKILTFVPEKARISLEYLAHFNGSLSEAFLIEKGLFTKEQIDYLLDKGILSKEYGAIYVKSYIKSYLQKSLTNIEKNKFHKYWKEFYSSQLPLKPAQRAVLISRNTMRAQIEYHAAHIIQEKTKSKQTPNMSLISYLNSDITAWNNYQKATDEETEKKQRPEPPESIKNRQRNKNLEKYELTKNELSLLGAPVELNKKADKDRPALSRTAEQRGEIAEKEDKPSDSIKNTYNLAISMEEVHNFETAATFFLQALEMKKDEQFKNYETKILEHLAFCCEKMNRTADAIDFYNRLIDLYSQNENLEKTNLAKLKIAQVYKNTYKLNHAKVIYEKFIKNASISNEIAMMSYIGLADIEAAASNNDKAMEYYEKAFSFDRGNLDNEQCADLSQACFRYAMILDENHETAKAIEYYQNSIDLSVEKTTTVSNAYTYLGDIMRDEGEAEKAIEFYTNAIDIDTELSNDEGVYYSALRLAIMYDSYDEEKTQHWLLKSLSAAKKTKDVLYITNAYVEIGDFYAKSKNWRKSLKAYLNAKITASRQENANAEENIENIEQKINRNKKHLENEVYERIVKEVLENE